MVSTIINPIIIFDTSNTSSKEDIIANYDESLEKCIENLNDEEINDLIYEQQEHEYTDFIENIVTPNNFGGLLLFGTFGAWNGDQYGAKLITSITLSYAIIETISTRYDSYSQFIYNKKEFAIKLIQPHHDGTNLYNLVIVKNQYIDNVYNMIQNNTTFTKHNLKNKVLADSTLFKHLRGFDDF